MPDDNFSAMHQSIIDYGASQCLHIQPRSGARVQTMAKALGETQKAGEPRKGEKNMDAGGRLAGSTR